MAILCDNAFLRGISAAAGSAYVPAGAIWLDGSADYLTWTPSGAGDSQRTFTLSAWVKPNLPTFDNIMSCGTTGTADSDNMALRFTTDGALQWGAFPTTNVLVTSALHRDPTAWMHVIGVCDTTDGIAANRLKLYVNGVEVTDFATDNRASNPTLNEDMAWGRAIAIQIGRDFGGGAPTAYYEGYMAEVIYLDGVAAGATDLGEFDANGNWVPINPSGLTFGTNGFHLNFADSADLGADASGNGNDFTPTSMSSANATNDSPTDDAENGYGNFDHWNPLSSGGHGSTFSNGNNTWSDASGSGDAATGTIAVSSGKWICEFEIDAVTSGLWLGVWGMETQTASTPFKSWDSNNDIAGDHGTWVIKPSTGYTVDGDGQGDPGTNQSLSTWSATDRLTIALDMDQGAGSNKMWIAKNGTWENSGDPDGDSGAIFTNLPERVVFVVGNRSSGTDTVTMRADSSTWEDSPSNATTFKDLCTANLPTPTVTDPSAYFQTVLYEGDGTAIGSSGNAITSVGFQPDFVWIKNRDADDSHMLFDVARGATKHMETDDGSNGETTDTESLSTFDSDGFTLGNNTAVNTNAESYVAWCWKLGGSASSNTDGGLTTNVTVADHGGMSVGTYTGDGTDTSFGHGLTAGSPEFVVVKKRSGGSAYGWTTWHKDLAQAYSALFLHSTAAAVNGDINYWSAQAPDATKVYVKDNSGQLNASTHTYSFLTATRTPGLIGIGSYTGNGSADGPSVVVDDGGSGFRPAFVLIKNIDAVYSWVLYDNERGYNGGMGVLSPDSSSTESTGVAHDFLANGFKVRRTHASENASGNTYIYLAFAEFPFGGSGISQARAR